MDTFERVRTILVNILAIPEDSVTPDASLMNDLGADSLAVVEITMAVEEEFDIKIEDEEALALETVDQMVRCIECDSESHSKSGGQEEEAGNETNWTL